jgi:hypothetical protein
VFAGRWGHSLRILSGKSESRGEMAVGLGMDLIRRFGLHFMTPFENLGSILEHGLLSRNEVLARGVSFVDISDHAVQAHRRRPEPVFGRSIHDYVPLYLNHMNAMLYSRREIRDSLVILEVDREVAEQAGALFCDGNAAAADTEFSTEPDVLIRAREALEAEYWRNVEDGTRRRMAEVLVPDMVSTDSIGRAICNNQALVAKIRQEHDLYASLDTTKFY